MASVERKGFAWYESEVPPAVVGELLGHPVTGRSYQMPTALYLMWLNLTDMDMVYGYVPWHYGRLNEEDEWGRFVYKKGLCEVGDLIDRPPYEGIRKRVEELLEIRGDRGVEWALYNTPQIAIDALGLEKFCYELADHPVPLMDWMKHIDERVEKELEVILEYPVEVIQISQPMCDKNGPMFNAEQLHDFFIHFLNRRIDRIRAEIRLVSLHCDGNNVKIFPRLNVDVFNGYDGDNFERDYKATKWGWRGTVSTTLLATGTPEEIKVYVEGMPNQVIGSEDAWDMPVVNFKAMMECARTLRK